MIGNGGKRINKMEYTIKELGCWIKENKDMNSFIKNGNITKMDIIQSKFQTLKERIEG